MLMKYDPRGGAELPKPVTLKKWREENPDVRMKFDPFAGLPRGGWSFESDPFGLSAWPDAPAVSAAPGYDKLASVFVRAFEQASAGKGKERHASDGVPFEDQPMSSINRTLGSIDGFLFQAAKKAAESRRLPDGRAQAELLGAINYLAGAVIALDTWAKK